MPSYEYSRPTLLISKRAVESSTLYSVIVIFLALVNSILADVVILNVSVPVGERTDTAVFE